MIGFEKVEKEQPLTCSSSFDVKEPPYTSHLHLILIDLKSD